MTSSTEGGSLFSRMIDQGKTASGRPLLPGMVDPAEEIPKPTVNPELRAQILHVGLQWQLAGKPWGNKDDMSKCLVAKHGKDIKQDGCYEAMGILASEMTMKSRWGGPSTEGPYIEVPADIPGKPFERYFSIAPEGTSVVMQTITPDQVVEVIKNS